MAQVAPQYWPMVLRGVAMVVVVWGGAAIRDTKNFWMGGRLGR
ncbi:hypothetical protein [Trichothermofontia sp.]